MRKIKFRGKTQDGEWVYGDLIHSGTDTIAILELDAPCLELVTDVVPDTIGQFTGLHDKNGKEIYEGDILREEGVNGFIRIVEWYRHFAQFRCTCHETKSATDVFSLVLMNYKVCGNIHDNPNLLTDGRN